MIINCILAKLIRDLNVEGKVKQFPWKVGQKVLPTKLNLFNKNITNNSICPICQRDVKSSIHALWNCPIASYVWAKNDNLVRIDLLS